jgi:hypothetical protein
MDETSGIVKIIELYNFINTNLIKDELKISRKEDYIELSQPGILIILPKFLNEIIIVPPKFKVGHVRKSDLISLYNSLKFIVDKEGRVPNCYMNSITVPTKFGFQIWSRYPIDGNPGVKFITEFKFKVRNKIGIVIR